MDRIAGSSAVDRAALFRRTEAAMTHACHAAIVEKDFWVCWILRRLFEVLQFRPPDKPSRERLSRHYYDLFRLARQPIAERALGQRDLLERVIGHKSCFFAQSWAHYESARPGTLRLLPEADRMDVLRRDYQAMKSMIFGEAPEWDDIVRELMRMESRINGHAR